MGRVDCLKKQIYSDDINSKSNSFKDLVDIAIETDALGLIWEEVFYLPSDDSFDKIWKLNLSKNPYFMDYDKEMVFDSLKAFHCIMEFIENDSNDPIPADMLYYLTSDIAIEDSLLERNFPPIYDQWSKSEIEKLVRFNDRFSHFRDIFDLEGIFETILDSFTGTKLQEKTEELFFIKLNNGLLDENYCLITGCPVATYGDWLPDLFWGSELCEDIACVIMDDLVHSSILQFMIKDIISEMGYRLHEDDWHWKTLSEDSEYKLIISDFIPSLLEK